MLSTVHCFKKKIPTVAGINVHTWALFRVFRANMIKPKTHRNHLTFQAVPVNQLNAQYVISVTRT